jgi:hypothetical protein
MYRTSTSPSARATPPGAIQTTNQASAIDSPAVDPDDHTPHRDREAGLSSVDAFVLCALIVAAVAAATPAIASGVSSLANTIAGYLGA